MWLQSVPEIREIWANGKIEVTTCRKIKTKFWTIMCCKKEEWVVEDEITIYISSTIMFLDTRFEEKKIILAKISRTWSLLNF